MLLSIFTWYEISLMDEDHRYHDQSSLAKVVGSSSYKEAIATVERLSVECHRELASEFEI